MTDCRICRKIGWIIDAELSHDPLTAELIECVHPECQLRGRAIEHLSFKSVGFTRVVRSPDGRIMAVGR